MKEMDGHHFQILYRRDLDRPKFDQSGECTPGAYMEVYSEHNSLKNLILHFASLVEYLA